MTADSADGDPLLWTENLTKRFGGLTAVDGVDFALHAGEIRCIIGPNGAGKSTFFALLSGQLAPDEGRIVYRGEEIATLEPYERARRGLSLKFQNLRVYPELTVRENVRIPAQRVASGDEREERMTDLLSRVNLSDRAETRVDDLSHGQQQWLEIAMSIAIDPTLLLLDEPTAGMTIDETRETGELVQSLAAGGIAVVVVEHDIAFVRQIAQSATVLHNGGVFTEGSIDDIEADEEVQRIYLGQPRGDGE